MFDMQRIWCCANLCISTGSDRYLSQKQVKFQPHIVSHIRILQQAHALCAVRMHGLLDLLLDFVLVRETAFLGLAFLPSSIKVLIASIQNRESNSVSSFFFLMGTSYSYPNGPASCRSDPDCDPLINNARNPGVVVLLAFWGVSLCTFFAYYWFRRLASGSPKVVNSSPPSQLCRC